MKELQKYTGQLGHTLAQCKDSFWEVSTINLKKGYKTPNGIFAAFLDPIFKKDDLIFETMVFKADEEGNKTDLGDYFLKRYPTAEEALIGHRKVVDGIEKGEIKPRRRDPMKDGW